MDILHEQRVDLGADELRRYEVTQLATNCYAYISEGECMVVDPGGSGAQIAEKLSDVQVSLIVATHGHGDHVGGVAALKRATGARYLIHVSDAERATHAGRRGEMGRTYDEDAPEPDGFISEGDVIKIGSACFRVMETPGHTPGGVVLIGEDTAQGLAFVGDTLFPSSHGRTDLDGGNEEEILRSLTKMARGIQPTTALLCGHGPSTTMEEELLHNPYMQRSSGEA